MKKIITLCLLACTAASTAFAAESGDASYQSLGVGVSAEYNWISMDQVNKQLNKGKDVTTIGTGIAPMLNVDVALAPFVMLGLRTGFMACQQGSASYNNILYNQKMTVDTSLIPVEAGLSANFGMPASPITIMAGIFGGYGFANTSIKNEFSALGQSASVTQPYTGGGAIGEVVAAINFKLLSALSLNINGGYRLAKMAQMTQSQDVSYNGIPFVSIPVGAKGDVLKDSDNKDLAFDYSGYHLGVGLSLGY